MKKKVFFSMLLVMFIFGAVACGNKEDSASKDKTDSSAKEILDAANKKYAEYQLKGTECKYTYMYADGSSEEETGATVFDVDNQISYSKYEQNGENSGEYFSVKEGEKYYSYVYDAEKEVWIRYEQSPDEDGKTDFQHQLDGELFLYGEEYGYKNIEYSNEGNETVEGVDTIKIKITMDDTSGSDDENLESMTKEDVLSDYGLEEEYVNQIEGLAEALDEYVEAINQSAYGVTTHFENYVWVDAKDYTPIKYESNTKFNDYDESGENSEEQMYEFEENCWKASMLEECMESGMSYDEAMEEIQENEKYMNQDASDEMEEEWEEDYEMDEDMESEQIGFQSIEIFRYGEDCIVPGSLPVDYKEIDENDYLYGNY